MTVMILITGREAPLVVDGDEWARGPNDAVYVYESSDTKDGDPLAEIPDDSFDGIAHNDAAQLDQTVL